MVVYHAGGLHVGVADGGAKKLEPSFFHVFADSVRLRATYRAFFLMVNDGLSIGHKAV